MKMKKYKKFSRPGSGDLIVDLVTLIVYLLYIMISEMIKGGKEYLASKKENEVR